MVTIRLITCNTFVTLCFSCFLKDVTEMNRMTLHRLSKVLQIPVNQLDHVLVTKMIGVNKDLPAVYKALKRDQLVMNAAKSFNLSLADVLSLIESQKHS